MRKNKSSKYLEIIKEFKTKQKKLNNSSNTDCDNNMNEDNQISSFYFPFEENINNINSNCKNKRDTKDSDQLTICSRFSFDELKRDIQILIFDNINYNTANNTKNTIKRLENIQKNLLKTDILYDVIFYISYRVDFE